MRRSEAEALAAEIRSQFGERIVAVPVVSRAMGKGRENPVYLRLSCIPANRSAPVYSRGQWHSLLAAWQWFFDEPTRARIAETLRRAESQPTENALAVRAHRRRRRAARQESEMKHA